MRILIVEDELMVARALARMTKEILGKDLMHLEMVECVSDAEAFLEDHAIDLLMLDLNLGGKVVLICWLAWLHANFRL